MTIRDWPVDDCEMAMVCSAAQPQSSAWQFEHPQQVVLAGRYRIPQAPAVAKPSKIALKMPANRTHTTQPTWRGFFLLAGMFFAACTAFAALTTSIEAWQEHVRARWPAATAQIESCSVDFAYSEEKYVTIVCAIRFTVEKEIIKARVTSRKARVPNQVYFRWPQNPVGEIEMQSWVDEHPKGKPIQVHYDPAKHAKVVLADSDMPLGNASTPGNLRVLGVFAAISVLFLAVGLIARRR
jgi:hypothetical protein